MRRRPRKVIETAGGESYTAAKKPQVRHEEIKVHRPLVRLLAQIEAYTRVLTFFHIPNQLLRRSALKKIFAALGVRSGIPDLCIPIAGGRVIWIECKHGKPESGEKALTDDQGIMVGKLRALGHDVYVISALDSHQAQEQLYAILERHGITDFRLRGPE